MIKMFLHSYIYGRISAFNGFRVLYCIAKHLFEIYHRIEQAWEANVEP